MFKIFSNLVSHLSPYALKSGAYGFGVFKNMLLESASLEMETGATLSAFLDQLLDAILGVLNTWIYIIAKYILMFIDFCQVITYKIAGIDNDLEKIIDLPIFKFLLNETVLKVIGAVLILGFLILIISTIVAIVKSEYNDAVEGKGDGKNGAYKALGQAAISVFLIVITPFIMIIAIIFSSVMLSSINNALNPNKTQNSTIGGTLFMTSAYHANKYRIYASNGKRIPIILDFDDPYDDGSYVYYSESELNEIYKSWNGKEIYNMISSGDSPTFNSTLAVTNGVIHNSNSYSDYERFVATAEQYQVMADFIDYAVANEITYYIKDSKDAQIDWNRFSSEIKISDGVYDPIKGTISITYTDESNLSPYDDYYTITFETATASASTPIQNAVATISLILGLNTLVSGQTFKDISVSSSSLGPVNITNASLGGSAGEVETLMQQISTLATDNEHTMFRMLERVEGSINVVRWQTEEAVYNGKEYPVYELKKIFRNKQTGAREVKATVKVAKRDDSLNSKYFVLKEDKNELGYYDYTNIEIDYYNDGEFWLDTLTPIFKKATWPEKLYNDLQVIYTDIDFDSYINYNNWSDVLGEYFKTGTGVTSDKVSSFATTLIHPLGLIMSELFLGTTLEGGNGTTSDFSFTSAYLDDIIDSLVYSLGDQYTFKNTKYQIEYFCNMFNAQFSSVIQNLKAIEGFDIYGTNRLSVQGYVYKAYLSSIMLSTDYGAYLNNIANTLVTSEKLLELMSIADGSITYDKDGNVKYKIEKQVEADGSYIPLRYETDGDPSGKAVYRSDGMRLYAANPNGILAYNTSLTGNDIDKLFEKSDLDNFDIKKVFSNSYNSDLSVTNNFDSNLIWIPKVGTRYKIDRIDQSAEIEWSSWFGLSESKSIETLTYYEYKVNVPEDGWVTFDDLLNDEKYRYTQADADADPNDDITNDMVGEYKYLEKYYALEEVSTTTDGGKTIPVYNVYVYEPLNYDTTLDNAKVERVFHSVAIDSPGMTYYYLIEVTKELETVTQYLTYGDLPIVYQRFIDKIILDIEQMMEDDDIDEPVYLKFLKEFQANEPSMKEVMAANPISANTAKNYLRDYDKIVEEIEDCIEKLKKENTLRLKNKLRIAQTKLNCLKKYYIIAGIESYTSTQVTKNFTVVVNGHSYNVSQGMNQRQLIETIYGNKITYSSLIGKLGNQTAYSKLGAFDQDAFLTMKPFVTHYLNEIQTVVNLGIGSGGLNEKQVDIIQALYSIYTGTYVNLSNEAISKMDANKREDIQITLSKLVSSVNNMIDRYEKGKDIESGLGISMNKDEAYALLTGVFEYAIKNEQLYFVEEDYEGLIDEDYVAFGLLKDFLTEFGGLCFSLARESNLSSITKPEKDNILDHVTKFIAVLNNRLDELDLGADLENIKTVKDSSSLTSLIGNINSLTLFNQLDSRSKSYVYTLYELYSLKVQEYEYELQQLEDAKNYASRFIKGRYAMQSDSYIYEKALYEYFDYFKYNVDIMAPTFEEKYKYDGYYGSFSTREDRLFYYNLYLESFDDISLGKSGLYYSQLSDLQQKVISDLSEYLTAKFDNFTKDNDNYLSDLNTRDILSAFIFDGATMGSTEIKGVNQVAVKNNKSVLMLFDEKDANGNNENINLLNLKNLLAFVGIDFGIHKTLANYRLDALNLLVDFEERAGESGASIQARYLTLLNIACADYETNAIGERMIQISSDTKNIIKRLAGIEDRAEELLVGLEYEVVNTNSIADEKYGSVFIICTFNEETNMYEPFVFANKPDSVGTPHTAFYSSSDGSLRYYPVIAKGVIGPDDLPTAIREVNGYIEFYRETATIIDPGKLGLEMHYLSMEDVSLNYNPVNVIVNALSTAFTGKSLAQHIMDSVPVVTSNKDLNFLYGKRTECVYHLDKGEFTLNYMFFNDTGIALNCLYNSGDLNGIILIFGCLVLATSIINAMWGVIQNIYELVLLALIYPGVFGLYPLTNEPTGNWRKEFINKITVLMGYIIGINGFFIILNLLQRMDISITLSPESLAELQTTALFSWFDLQGIIDILAYFAMFLVACTLLKVLPGMFAKMANVGGDVTKTGESTFKAVQDNWEQGTDFASGHMIEDKILGAVDSTRNALLGKTPTRAERKEKIHQAQNAKAVQNYKDQLTGMGISEGTTEKAVKAYEDSLNRQLEAQRQRREADKEARNARIQKRATAASARNKKKSKEPRICSKCGKVHPPKFKGKECTNCKYPLPKA